MLWGCWFGLFLCVLYLLCAPFCDVCVCCVLCVVAFFCVP
jgi:hypothetical protein